MADLKASDVRRRLLGYLLQNKSVVVAGVGCGAMVALTQGGVIWALKKFVGIATRQPVDASGLGLSCAAIIGLYVLLGLFKYGQGTLLAKAALKTGLAIRHDVFDHLLRLSLSYYHRRQTGALLSTLTTDITKLQTGAMMLKDFVATPIQGIVYLVLLFVAAGEHWYLVIAAFVILPFMAALVGRLTKRVRGLSKESQRQQAGVSAVMEEALSAPRTVQAFSAEARELTRFDRVSEETIATLLKTERRRALLGPVGDLIGAFAVAGVLYVGAQKMDFDKLIQLLLLLSQFANTVGLIGNLKTGWEEMMGAADRIFGEVLDVPSDIQSKPNAIRLERATGKLEFRDVSFEYAPDVPVLSQVDLTIEPGQVVALVGETGAGKSTLADLVPRFYDPTAGAVLLDGTDLRELSLADLRKQIGIVPQETRLFHGTIRENLLYGRPDATDAELISAAEAANVAPFVGELADGYETMVGDRGQTLSGGQRQRVAIARALLADPRILILDEATSALDNTTEALVQEALGRLMQGRTTLIIAHRLTTISHADKIVVLERPGRIVEVGTHAELLARGGKYAALWDAQGLTELGGAL